MRYFTKKLVGFYYRVVFPEKAVVMTDGIRHGLLIPPCLFPSPSGGLPSNAPSPLIISPLLE